MGKGPKMRRSIFYALGIAAAAAVLFIGCDESLYDLPPEYILTTDVTPPGSGTVQRSPDYKIYSDSQDVAVSASAKDGYRFVRWEGSLSSTESTVSVRMNKDKTLVAVFRKVETDTTTPSKSAYTVIFDANGGSVSPASAQTGTDGKLTPFSLPTPTRSDNSFKGWYTATTGGSAVTTSTVFNANSTVYAQWTATSFPPSTGTTSPNAYAITFNPNGGTVSPTTATTGTDGKLAILPAPTRTGYAFNGWFTAATGGTEITTSTAFTAKVTIYAQWTPFPYTVTFDHNYTGGTKSTDVTGTGGKLASPLPTPNRDGYTLEGWFTEKSGGTRITTSTVFDKNDTVYAQWTLITYAITFNPNGGTVSPTSAATGEGGKLAILPAPTRTGYAFNGWFTAATGGTAVNTSTVFTAPKTVYAQWMPITYTVTFDVNGSGGTVSPKSAVTGDGGKLTLSYLPEPERYGYEFIDWWTMQYGGERIRINRVYTENTTVYAIWQAEGAPSIKWNTITFNANGGTGTVPGPFQVVAGYGTPLPNGNGLTKTGYTFDGWNTKTEGTGTPNYAAGDSYTPTGNVTLFAQWTINTYTVTFNSQGGSTVTSQTVIYNEKATEPAAPTRTGYTFGGWYKEAACTNAWNFATDVVTSATTLHAKWTVDPTPPPSTTTPYKITFHPRGGSVSPTSANTDVYGRLASLPTPTINGNYAFNGWFTAATGGNLVTINKVYTSDTTIYAQWIDIYTITFQPRGGSVSPTFGKTGAGWKLASLPTPTRSDYTFNGWFTAVTGGDSVTINKVYTADTTIYARWVATPPPTTYTVTFNSQGGSSVSSQTIEHGSKVAEPPNPTHTGFTFGGWYKEAACTNAWNFATDVVTGPTTLYAKWTPNSSPPPYTITFNANGGTVSQASATTGTDGRLAILPAPKRDGYGSDGWFTAATGGTAVTTSTEFTADATVYAQWTPYTVIFDPTGGTVSPPSAPTVGGKLPTLPVPTRSGYTFDKWYTAVTGGTAVTTSTIFTVPQTTIYARWTRITYTITYVLNSGTVSPSNPPTYNVETANFTLNNPTRTGYTFAGWTGANGTTPQTSVTITNGSTENRSYTANWEIIKYTVTFDANGGTVDPSTVKTSEGWKLTILPAPNTRAGYSFLGWFTATTGGTKVDENKVYNADITLYAQWMEKMD